MNKHIVWAWAIKNSLSTLGWIALAILFGKWWIALFGLLFISDMQTKVKGAYRICDRCGESSPVAETRKEAINKARAKGWLCLEEEEKDYCPDCVNDVPRLKKTKCNINNL